MNTPALVMPAVQNALVVGRAQERAQTAPGRTAYTFVDFATDPRSAAMSLT